MRQEEALDGAVKDDDLYVLVGFECGDDLTQFRNRLGPKIFKGGLSNVTRQYDEVRRTKRICLVFARLLMFASEFGFAGSPFTISSCPARNCGSCAHSPCIDVGVSPLFIPLKAQAAE